MAWYRTGTISLTNGSTAVTGSGTAWISNAAVGEALLAPDGKLYEIANIASDTSITLGSGYLGTTQSGQAYVIVPSQSYIRDLAAQAAALVNNYSTFYNTVGQGKFPDGAVATPAISFSNDTNTGLYRSAADEVTLVANGVAIAKWNTSGFSFVSGVSTITANSASPALKITQTGTGNALVVEDAASDTTPFVIDQNGVVIAGGTSAAVGYGQLQSQTTGSFAGIYGNFSADTNPVVLTLSKSKSSTLGSYASAVVNGDSIGRIQFTATDGSGGLVRAAQIEALVDGTPGPNDMPGRLVFSTTADNSSTPTERMRIDSAGRVGIGGAAGAQQRLLLTGNATGSTSATGFTINLQVQPDVTSTFYGVQSEIGTAAAEFTLANLRHFSASGNVIGAGSTVTNHYGFFADSDIAGATNNYGFYGNISAATGRWNFYAGGTASNHFAGDVLFGSTNKDTTSTVWAPYQINATSGTAASLGQYAWNAAPGACPFHTFNKSRGGSVGARGAVASGDELGNIYFAGDDGTNFVRGVLLRAIVDGTPSTGVMPGAFVISTTATGGGAPTDRLRIDSSGNVLVKSAAGLGYGTGSGGTVTQVTSKSTSVTLNKPCGAITTTADALAAGASVNFLVNNSVIELTDCVLLTMRTGGASGANYAIKVSAISNGVGFYVTLTNVSGGSLSEAVIINYVIIKGAAA